jgi:hypothetical protein
MMQSPRDRENKKWEEKSKFLLPWLSMEPPYFFLAAFFLAGAFLAGAAFLTTFFAAIFFAGAFFLAGINIPPFDPQMRRIENS